MVKKKPYSGDVRDSGGFIALPFSVVDSVAYAGLSAHAKVLLIEIARQIVGGNNGSLLCSRAYMVKRGWRSNDMLTKCRDELLAAKLIYQTVQGHRPNKASWFAVTWISLAKLKGYDFGATEGFQRGAYKALNPLPVKPTREQLYEKWRLLASTNGLGRTTGQEVAALSRVAVQ